MTSWNKAVRSAWPRAHLLFHIYHLHLHLWQQWQANPTGRKSKERRENKPGSLLYACFCTCKKIKNKKILQTIFSVYCFSECSNCLDLSGAANDDFLLNTLKAVFTLSRVLLHLKKSILSGAIKFVSVRSTQGNLSPLMLPKWEFFLFLCPSPFLIRIFVSFFTKNSLTWGVKCEKLNYRKSEETLSRLFHLV